MFGLYFVISPLTVLHSPLVSLESAGRSGRCNRGQLFVKLLGSVPVSLFLNIVAYRRPDRLLSPKTVVYTQSMAGIRPSDALAIVVEDRALGFAIYLEDGALNDPIAACYLQDCWGKSQHRSLSRSLFTTTVSSRTVVHLQFAKSVAGIRPSDAFATDLEDHALAFAMARLRPRSTAHSLRAIRNTAGKALFRPRLSLMPSLRRILLKSILLTNFCRVFAGNRPGEPSAIGVEDGAFGAALSGAIAAGTDICRDFGQATRFRWRFDVPACPVAAVRLAGKTVSERHSPDVGRLDNGVSKHTTCQRAVPFSSTLFSPSQTDSRPHIAAEVPFTIVAQAGHASIWRVARAARTLVALLHFVVWVKDGVVRDPARSTINFAVALPSEHQSSLPVDAALVGGSKREEEENGRDWSATRARVTDPGRRLRSHAAATAGVVRRCLQVSLIGEVAVVVPSPLGKVPVPYSAGHDCLDCALSSEGLEEQPSFGVANEPPPLAQHVPFMLPHLLTDHRLQSESSLPLQLEQLVLAVVVMQMHMLLLLQARSLTNSLQFLIDGASIAGAGVEGATALHSRADPRLQASRVPTRTSEGGTDIGARRCMLRDGFAECHGERAAPASRQRQRGLVGGRIGEMEESERGWSATRARVPDPTRRARSHAAASLRLPSCSTPCSTSITSPLGSAAAYISQSRCSIALSISLHPAIHPPRPPVVVHRKMGLSLLGERSRPLLYQVSRQCLTKNVNRSPRDSPHDVAAAHTSTLQNSQRIKAFIHELSSNPSPPRIGYYYRLRKNVRDPNRPHISDAEVARVAADLRGLHKEEVDARLKTAKAEVSALPDVSSSITASLYNATGNTIYMKESVSYYGKFAEDRLPDKVIHNGCWTDFVHYVDAYVSIEGCSGAIVYQHEIGKEFFIGWKNPSYAIFYAQADQPLIVFSDHVYPSQVIVEVGGPDHWWKIGTKEYMQNLLDEVDEASSYGSESDALFTVRHVLFVWRQSCLDFDRMRSQVSGITSNERHASVFYVLLPTSDTLKLTV
ncbi:hypothetical protein MIND_00654000 [Mycena indigotica]|uniref:Uncharacterized protein n=1 Tax=Mycena indigotica TaxID=2126181 RepID=A0A8H6W779_9AGAR|nr:uncharacterized protein MIND_00654000 [Mycena indigotica]KAF7304218.1 hypothetical protein MIND_00654000 [Mycena indigotica]